MHIERQQLARLTSVLGGWRAALRREKARRRHAMQHRFAAIIDGKFVAVAPSVTFMRSVARNQVLWLTPDPVKQACQGCRITLPMACRPASTFNSSAGWARGEVRSMWEESVPPAG